MVGNAIVKLQRISEKEANGQLIDCSYQVIGSGDWCLDCTPGRYGRKHRSLSQQGTQRADEVFKFNLLKDSFPFQTTSLEQRMFWDQSKTLPACELPGKRNAINQIRVRKRKGASGSSGTPEYDICQSQKSKAIFNVENVVSLQISMKISALVTFDFQCGESNFQTNSNVNKFPKNYNVSICHMWNVTFSVDKVVSQQITM